MTRRVLLHVGAPKSGTTYLQEKCRLNAALLEEQGLTYPPTRSKTHFLPALDLIQRNWGGELERAAGAWDELVAQTQKVSGDVLITHEILAAATPEQVQRAVASFPDDEVHVVYTARDLARQVPAEWQENLKHRAKVPFQRFLDRLMEPPRTRTAAWFWRVQGLPDVLTRWGSGLPAERVHVVTVPPKGAPHELLWERFCRVLGVDPQRDYAESEAVNSSIGIAEAAMLRRLNRRLPPAVLGRDAYVDLVRNVVVRDTLSQREDMVMATVPPEHRDFFDDIAAQWRDWLEGSGVDVVGDIADLEPCWPEATPDDRLPDRPGPGKVADAAIEALAAVILEVDQRAQPTVLPRLTDRARRATRRILGS
jgi:hypothetical protein